MNNETYEITRPDSVCDDDRITECDSLGLEMVVHTPNNNSDCLLLIHDNKNTEGVGLQEHHGLVLSAWDRVAV